MATICFRAFFRLITCQAGWDSSWDARRDGVAALLWATSTAGWGGVRALRRRSFGLLLLALLLLLLLGLPRLLLGSCLVLGLEVLHALGGVIVVAALAELAHAVVGEAPACE